MLTQTLFHREVGETDRMGMTALCKDTCSMGQKHANIAIFVPHLGCPHQCSFCEQNTITGANCDAPPRPEDVLAAAETAAASLRSRQTAEIAFFGGSFTAIDREYMLSLLEAAKLAVERYGFWGVRCSTRPDAISPEILEILKVHRVTAIELGAQSMDDGVLEANRRGHTAQDTERATALIREAGFELGLQMMTGLYTDTEEKTMKTAQRLAGLSPQTVRIYPTIVLPGTELARLYQAGTYRPQTLEEAAELCARLLGVFEDAGVRVIRMGLHPGPELEHKRLAGPYHPAFRQIVESRRLLLRLLEALKAPGKYTVAVNPRDVSTALGQGRENVRRLAERGYNVGFIQDPEILRGSVRIENGDAPHDPADPQNFTG